MPQCAGVHCPDYCIPCRCWRCSTASTTYWASRSPLASPFTCCGELQAPTTPWQAAAPGCLASPTCAPATDVAHRPCLLRSIRTTNHGMFHLHRYGLHQRYDVHTDHCSVVRAASPPVPVRCPVRAGVQTLGCVLMGTAALRIRATCQHSRKGRCLVSDRWLGQAPPPAASLRSLQQALCLPSAVAWGPWRCRRLPFVPAAGGGAELRARRRRRDVRRPPGHLHPVLEVGAVVPGAGRVGTPMLMPPG